MSDRPRRDPGLYVHYPFCIKKCNYCDFYSVTCRGDRAWVDAVICEATARAPQFSGVFGTLYLGGGTPSLLAQDQLARLLTGLRARLDLNDGSETTLEVNPDDVTREIAEGWVRAGISRASVGVQSFDPDILRWMGRRHTAEQGHGVLDILLAAGLSDLGIDLIFGLPDQHDDSWRRELATAVAMEPAHISCYQLTAEGRTPLTGWVEGGRVTLPTDRRTRRLFVMAHEVLTGAGYEHYEISNYARSRDQRSRHNTRYWDHTPYLGLGPSAHSYRGDRRWWNVRSAEHYLERVQASGDAIAEEEQLTAEQLHLERLMLGFRTSDGVAIHDLTDVKGGRAALDSLLDEGLLIIDGERVVPTMDGFLVADSLPLRFV